jgi:uncharacterized repeat protein (TIGR03803 family)
MSRAAQDANLTFPGRKRSLLFVRKTPHGYASTPIILVSFCALANCADGAAPEAGVIADAKGNLFGTTVAGGASSACSRGCGTVFEITKTRHGYASTPTILVSFYAQANCADGALPLGGLTADAKGNLFGTTAGGGAHVVMSPGGSVSEAGTVFEIAKTDTGYASTHTILSSFCSLTNCADGFTPVADLISDTKGNLFGSTVNGGGEWRRRHSI